MKSVLLALAAAFSVNSFAATVTLDVNPTKPIILSADLTLPDPNTGAERVIPAPYFSATYTMTADADVIAEGLAIKVTTSDGRIQNSDFIFPAAIKMVANHSYSFQAFSAGLLKSNDFNYEVEVKVMGRDANSTKSGSYELGTKTFTTL